MLLNSPLVAFSRKRVPFLLEHRQKRLRAAENLVEGFARLLDRSVILFNLLGLAGQTFVQPSQLVGELTDLLLDSSTLCLIFQDLASEFVTSLSQVFKACVARQTHSLFTTLQLINVHLASSVLKLVKLVVCRRSELARLSSVMLPRGTCCYVQRLSETRRLRNKLLLLLVLLLMMPRHVILFFL